MNFVLSLFLFPFLIDKFWILNEFLRKKMPVHAIIFFNSCFYLTIYRKFISLQCKNASKRTSGIRIIFLLEVRKKVTPKTYILLQIVYLVLLEVLQCKWSLLHSFITIKVNLDKPTNSKGIGRQDSK